MDWEKEHEADILAQNALIPAKIWAKYNDRRSITSNQVISLAKEASVHPAVVAGRVRRETGNYRILSKLVGEGQVRHHFV